MKKEDLFKFCRYYKGEDVAPYNSDRLNLIWLQEKRWVEDMLDVNSQMTPYLDRYSRDNMRDFEQFDDIPITLKAYLYAYCLKGNELPSRDDFTQFYKLWNAKKVSS